MRPCDGEVEALMADQLNSLLNQLISGGRKREWSDIERATGQPPVMLAQRKLDAMGVLF